MEKMIGEGSPVHYRMFSSVPVSHSLEARSTCPAVTIQTISRHNPMGCKSFWVRATVLKAIFPPVSNPLFSILGPPDGNYSLQGTGQRVAGTLGFGFFKSEAQGHLIPLD